MLDEFREKFAVPTMIALAERRTNAGRR